MKNNYLCSLLLTVSLLLTPFAGAVATEIPAFDLDQVVITATKNPIKLSEAGANVSVITKEEIEKMHYRDVAEALKNIPGMSMWSYGVGGRANTLRINGSKDVVVLVDGKRMNPADGSSFDITNMIGMDSIERIEVVKGSSSALYGADAVGGVVNIITKKYALNKTTLRVAGGSFGRESYGVVHSGQDGTLSWYLTANKERIGDAKDGRGDTIKQSNDAKSYSLRLNKKIDYKSEISFTYQDYAGDEYYPGSTKSTYDPQKRVDDKQHSWDLTYSIQPSEKSKSQFRVYENTDDYTYYSQYAPRPNKMKSQGIQYQLDYQANDRHLITAGVDYYKNQLVSKNPEIVKNSNSFSFQDIWKLDKQFSLVSGVRFDHHETYGNNATPRFTLNYKKDDNTNCYLGYNKFFKAPTFFQLYDARYGNPNLEPQKGSSFEAGVNHRLDKTAVGSIHYFDRKTDNDIAYDYATRKYKNLTNQQKAHGWEVEVAKQFTPELSTTLGCTWAYAEGEGREKNIDGYLPKKAWNIGVDYNKDRYDLHLKGRGVEDRPGPKTDPIGKFFPQESYWVWDVALNVKIKQDTKAFLKVNNIFDEYYAEHSNARVSWYGQAEDWWPAPGREIIAGLEYSF